eukprot:scaffold40347_cov55-Attheya_sp.AAC.4
MGSVVFDVATLLGARGNTQVKKLKKGGFLFATIRKSEGMMMGRLKLKMRGEAMRNTGKSMFGKSDPFYELSKRISSVGGKTWNNVYRSEVIKKDLNPNWREMEI